MTLQLQFLLKPNIQASCDKTHLSTSDRQFCCFQYGDHPLCVTEMNIQFVLFPYKTRGGNKAVNALSLGIFNLWSEPCCDVIIPPLAFILTENYVQVILYLFENSDKVALLNGVVLPPFPLRNNALPDICTWGMVLTLATTPKR